MTGPAAPASGRSDLAPVVAEHDPIDDDAILLDAIRNT